MVLNEHGCYALLGVSELSTVDDIRRAYRKLALKLHPDKATGNEEEFKRVTEAYNLLMEIRSGKTKSPSPKARSKPSNHGHGSAARVRKAYGKPSATTPNSTQGSAPRAGRSGRRTGQADAASARTWAPGKKPTNKAKWDAFRKAAQAAAARQDGHGSPKKERPTDKPQPSKKFSEAWQGDDSPWRKKVRESQKRRAAAAKAASKGSATDPKVGGDGETDKPEPLSATEMGFEALKGSWKRDPVIESKDEAASRPARGPAPLPESARVNRSKDKDGGEKEGGGWAANIASWFRGSRTSKGQATGELDIQKRLQVSRAKMISGTEMHIAVNRNAACPSCSGGGDTSCICDGNGVVEVREIIEVVVPANSVDGNRVRISGKGHADANGSVADLYVLLEELA